MRWNPDALCSLYYINICTGYITISVYLPFFYISFGAVYQLFLQILAFYIETLYIIMRASCRLISSLLSEILRGWYFSWAKRERESRGRCVCLKNCVQIKKLRLVFSEFWLIEYLGSFANKSCEENSGSYGGCQTLRIVPEWLIFNFRRWIHVCTLTLLIKAWIAIFIAVIAGKKTLEEAKKRIFCFIL